ncbi:hypothetical protein [Listeria booriae]|uniref:LXG domain-containing protein n=1 Tax=Listeria booriae TaxID=1552123 RepID=A0A7X0ZUU4_9LIST|nr:hypothetical protein [Listeria booriae]MBC2283047.1 hypothetical protein [Listeria booriae]MBC2292309.1 hypothetical protein [Listeria booriae]MBC2304571.1 hypothetical protein [Listeria booriae]MBC2310924.1 hypothetical protein [Listeria booriae]
MAGKSHDFSQSSIDQLATIVNDVEDDGQWGWVDGMGDWTISIPELKEGEQSFQNHYQAVVDKHNIGAKDFDTILKDVESVDKEYESHYTSILCNLLAFNDKLKNISQLITPSVVTLSQTDMAAVMAVLGGKEVNYLYDRCMESDQFWQDILCKDVSEISDEEYAALALLYATIDKEKLDEFLKLCMNKAEDVDYTLVQEFMGPSAGQLNEDHSKWEPDIEKMNRIMVNLQGMRDNSVLLLQYVDSESNNSLYRELKNYSNDIMQRMTLLSVVRDTESFHGAYKGTEPDIEVMNQKDGSIVLGFKGYRNIGSPVSATFTNFADSSITISGTQNGNMIDISVLQESRVAFANHFGAPSLVGATTDFTVDQASGLAIDGLSTVAGDALERSGKIGLSKAIGCVPFIGDVISAGFDYYNDTQEHQANTTFIEGQLLGIENAQIYSNFDCVASLVTLDTADTEGSTIYIEVGQETHERVRKVNEACGTNFTVADIVQDPQKVINKVIELRDSGLGDAFDEAIAKK